LGDGTNTGKTIPTRIGAGTDWKIIACGAEHTVAQLTNGNIYAWGNGQDGALGNNNDANQNSPVSINITNVQSISCGSLHSLTIKTDNKLWAWGYNGSHQFGNGTGTNSLIPIEVACPAFLGISAFAESEYEIFPNPVNDILTIQNSSNIPFEKIVIADLAGKRIMEETSFQPQIDVSNLKPGMYFLQIAYKGNYSTIKFIKR